MVFKLWRKNRNHVVPYVTKLLLYKMEAGNVAVDLTFKTLDAADNLAKKIKLSGGEDNGSTDGANNTVHSHISSFQGFRCRKVLNENSQNKSIFVEGTFDSDEGTAVLLLEKLPFCKDSIDKLLTEDTQLTQKFCNDIYGGYEGFPRANLNGIRATIIHPATEKHVQKYTYQPLFMVNETPEIYKDVVLPYLESQQFSVQWVHNILEHKSEQDRIIFEDPNPETGFILIPDMKWDETQLDNPYVIAICHARELKSLRDLTAEHIPLLKNMKEKCSEAILKKFNKPLTRFRVYFHYQPSYYHLHVHFSTFESDAPGTQAERAHLLDTVISNLELMSDYYKRATLTYAIKSSDPLFEKLKEAGVI